MGKGGYDMGQRSGAKSNTIMAKHIFIWAGRALGGGEKHQVHGHTETEWAGNVERRIVARGVNGKRRMRRLCSCANDMEHRP